MWPNQLPDIVNIIYYTYSLCALSVTSVKGVTVLLTCGVICIRVHLNNYRTLVFSVTDHHGSRSLAYSV